MLKQLILIAALLSCFVALAENESPAPISSIIDIRSVGVGDKSILPHRNEVNLGPSPQNIAINFSPNTNAPKPIRIHYKLDGMDTKWRDGSSFMTLTARFFNAAGDQVGQDIFNVSGESAGWTGSLKTSPLTHRREAIAVPPRATRLWIVISSAGPPETVGIYVVANLVVTKHRGTAPPDVIIESPFDRQSGTETGTPADWKTDGIAPSMAKIVAIGQAPAQRAFAILDDDAGSHAEWRTIMESAPFVAPGDQILIEWNEMYSIGLSKVGSAHYANLSEGNYRFHAEPVDIYGNASGAETTLMLLVPPPFWKTSWFWSIVTAFAFSLAIGGNRYLAWHQMRREMLRLKNQQALDKERLRIAQDIHDDLGARITEISLASALAQKRPELSSETNEDFKRISRMSRELVSALYETVWAINPENDNLDALGGYLCQTVNPLCEQAQIACRFVISDLPGDVALSSQIRHNVIMVVKEAIHNIIKHSKASEVHLYASFEKGVLSIEIRDNGCGFDIASHPAGNGLINMKRRITEMGGTCEINSHTAQGASVQVRLPIQKLQRAQGTMAG